MEDLLFLTHRIPWPPNKGDKIRSYHLLRFLARHYRVHLGCFVDDPRDWASAAAVRAVCATACLRPLSSHRARWRAVRGLLSGEPLTLPWYRDRPLQRWVDTTVAAHGIERALLFSAAMGPYLSHHDRLLRVVDFVDVDSAKWTAYASTRPWPLSAIYRREGRRLLEYERRLAGESDAALFVSPQEAAAFCSRAPEVAARVHALSNGVDSHFFAPHAVGANPYPPTSRPLVFTGAMDYWPNVDAVVWFAESVLPRVRETLPEVEFYIVGSRPTPQVTALSRLAGVHVTGFVDDMRPWLGHAALAVAPLRIARGIQNKVLEAMALARPVVASPQALEGLSAVHGSEVIAAEAEAEPFARAVCAALTTPNEALASRARARIESDYEWEHHLCALSDYLHQPRALSSSAPRPREQAA